MSRPINRGGGRVSNRAPGRRPPAFCVEPDRGDVTGFVCAQCGRWVPAAAAGTAQRNHCPHCLWSLHVDVRPGDRSNLCRGVMEPVALWVNDSGELRLIHRCARCGALRPNRIAGDDSEPALEQIATRAWQRLETMPTGATIGS